MLSENDSHSITAANDKALVYRLRQYRAMTPAERLKLSEQLRTDAFSTLRSNPAAWQAFVKRNHHQRRAANVARLEAEMRGIGG